MSKEALVTIENGRVSGRVIEKIFFHDSRAQLEGFWGVPIDELAHTDTLVIPDVAMSYIIEQRANTNEDGKERGAIFGYQEDVVVIENENIGKESFYECFDAGFVSGMQASVEFGDGIFGTWNSFFAKPRPILFHTHPRLPMDRVERLTLRLKNGEEMNVDPSLYQEYVDYLSDIFSPSDLGTILQNNRYINSLLLSTGSRIMYITPRVLFLPFGLMRFDRTEARFERNIDILVAAKLCEVTGLTPEILIASFDTIATMRYGRAYSEAKKVLALNPTEKDLLDMRDMALLEALDKSGYELFVSDGPEDPRLKHVKDI